MGNIYIETDESFRVTKIHRMPFDPNNGMGYTREELEKKGFFVNEIPNPVNQVGRRSVAMYNPDTKSVYYEYVGIPMSEKERLDYLENAVSFMARNALYGANPAVMMRSARPQEEEHTIDPGVKAIGEYIAYQVISGKITMDTVMKDFYPCVDVVKEVLMENGIQV